MKHRKNDILIAKRDFRTRFLPDLTTSNSRSYHKHDEFEIIEIVHKSSVADSNRDYVFIKPLNEKIIHLYNIYSLPNHFNFKRA